MWESFGVRMWHPGDMQHLSYDVYLSMAAAVEAEARERKSEGG